MKMRDLESGVAAMKSVLDRANAAIDRTKKEQEVEDLVGRVDDWKGHKIEHFGHLITYGNHTVLKGDNGKEEREVRPWDVFFCILPPHGTRSIHFRRIDDPIVIISYCSRARSVSTLCTLKRLHLVSLPILLLCGPLATDLNSKRWSEE